MTTEEGEVSSSLRRSERSSELSTNRDSLSRRTLALQQYTYDPNEKKKNDEEGEEEEDSKALVEEEDELALMMEEGGSDSEKEEDEISSVDSAQEKEAAIRDGFLGFLYGYIGNGIFQRLLEHFTKCFGCMYKWTMKKLGKGEEDDMDADVDDMPGMDDLAGEVMDAVDPGFNPISQSVQGGLGGPPGGGGGGGGAAGPPPGVAEMAAAAGNSAAGGAASGAAAAGAAAAAGSVGGMAAAAGAVAGAGIAAQASVAVGVAAVTAAAITTATAPAVPPAPAPYMVGNFTPPVCMEETTEKIGALELQIAALPPLALEERKWALEEMFRDIYNSITGMCLDPMVRVLHQAVLLEWETDWGVGSNITMDDVLNFTQEQYDAADLADTARMLVAAHSNTHWHRQLLQFDLSEFFSIFVASFGYNLEPVLLGDGNQSVTITSNSSIQARVVSAFTRLIIDGVADRNATVSSLDADAIAEAYLVVEDNNGTIRTAFVSDILQDIEKCLDVNDASSENEICQILNNVDVGAETLSLCLQNPTSLECQEILPTVLEAASEEADALNTDVSGGSGGTGSLTNEPTPAPHGTDSEDVPAEMSQETEGSPTSPGLSPNAGGSTQSSPISGPTLSSPSSLENSPSIETTEMSPAYFPPSSTSGSGDRLEMPAAGPSSVAGNPTLTAPTLIAPTAIFPSASQGDPANGSNVPSAVLGSPNMVVGPSSLVEPPSSAGGGVMPGSPATANGPAAEGTSGTPSGAGMLGGPSSSIAPAGSSGQAQGGNSPTIGNQNNPTSGAAGAEAPNVNSYSDLSVNTPTVVAPMATLGSPTGTVMSVGDSGNPGMGNGPSQTPGSPIGHGADSSPHHGSASMPIATQDSAGGLPSPLMPVAPVAGPSTTVSPSLNGAGPTNVDPTVPVGMPTNAEMGVNTPTAQEESAGIPTATPQMDTPDPTTMPTFEPTSDPTSEPTPAPTFDPTVSPTPKPTFEQTIAPTQASTDVPTSEPSIELTPGPTTVLTLPPTATSEECNIQTIDTQADYVVSIDNDISSISNDLLVTAFISGYNAVPKSSCSPTILSVTITRRVQNRRLQSGQSIVFTVSSTQPNGSALFSSEEENMVFLQAFNSALGIAGTSATSIVLVAGTGTTTEVPTVTPGSPSATPTTASPSSVGFPTTTAPTTDVPTVTPGSPSATPTTASPSSVGFPTTGAPTTRIPPKLFGGVLPGSPSATQPRKPRLLASQLQGTHTDVPTVTPGSPSATPTTATPSSVGFPTTGAPTTDVPTVTPGSPSATPTTASPSSVGFPTTHAPQPMSPLLLLEVPLQPQPQ
ncbi:ECF subfamily RNA polymerase sigma-24 subunit [Seminavis robusta]|uniref:ECF subfamily RNA polymerase sigma-24 subunit n=1 Tax=Seminavis robusta TaxID=568900 RepID=A0A9N8DFL8_9STRA|nr:ECF subfamily RNA polymerase sigma-24 subunit [Seminavis robusta]|eukprot:Sro118_g057670.1 ECF subfamily RNA polymerase sigma-24 subunit (1312) ;mRNA; f:26879-31938